MGKHIYLLIGESGSGKTTLANQLSKDGMKQLWSYTTRPARSVNEPGHIFVEKFPQDAHCVAYTKFNHYDYWATEEQVEECDVYVIDPAGLEWFLDHYHGKKTPVVFFIDTSRRIRRKRMKERGDDSVQVRSRLRHDKEAFKEFRQRLYRCDDTLPVSFIIDNNGSDGITTLRSYIAMIEEGDLDSYSV